MGRTLLPFRPALEQEISSWKGYKHGLGPEEQKIFDILVQYARQHADAGSLAARPLLSEVVLFSIALEQQKCIVALEARLHNLEKTQLMKKGAHSS
ncbi:MAG: hypothetical protein ACTSWW_05665 [Promethearchaeota archaeon]